MRLYKNVIWTILSRYGAQGLAVITNILLARHLGVSGYGEYALASAVILIGNAFTNFGMDMVIIRRVALGREPALLSDGLWLQVFLSVVFIAAVLLIGWIVFLPLSLKVYVFSLLPLSFYSIFTIVIRARQHMQVFSISQLMISALNFLSVALVWLLDGDIFMVVVLSIIVHFVVAVWGMAHPEARITQWRFSVPHIFALIKECSHMALIGTLRLVYEKIPFTLLPMLTSLSAVGVFSLASRVVDFGKLGHQSALTAMYPEMARDVDFGKQMKGLRLLLNAALLISVILFLLAKPIILILFGAEFLLAVLPLQIMVWSIAPYVLATYIAVGLVALGFERTMLLSRFVVLACLVAFIFLLTPQFGNAGSAAAVLLAELVHAAILWQVWRQYVLSKLP